MNHQRWPHTPTSKPPSRLPVSQSVKKRPSPSVHHSPDSQSSQDGTPVAEGRRRSGGHFTAAPTNDHGPQPKKLASPVSKRLSTFAPTPASPLCFPPSRRCLDAYGMVVRSAVRKGGGRADRIRVCVRKRPVLRGDGVDCVQVMAKQCMVSLRGERNALDGISKELDQHEFFFDRAFGEHHSNADVLIRLTSPVGLQRMRRALAGLFLCRR